ncbi:MAG: peptidoglycan LD-endopeptidase LytH [Thermoanaerobaculia bacterium]|jgi:murein DD-endopeptidase MepM/ murein hydrolase activator NlpD|nr:peptidoglycan LD-endopeptidase LytH [Thermoanaerobaculia bacterium]
MTLHHARSGWAGTFVVLSGLMFTLNGCATAPAAQPMQTAPAVSRVTLPSDEDDWSQLRAQMRVDLSRYNTREIARTPTGPTPTATKVARDQEFAAKAREMFAPLSRMPLRLPVVGIRTSSLDDSWHAPRDGGARVHKGIDIFAPKGTEVVAVTDGVISFIGDEKLGGHCIWLTTENGASFFYAHLDRWAAGLYEGMEVQSGDLLGYVGNTGNARYTPSHLHFGVDQNDEMVNPYPLLTQASPTLHAHVHTTLSGGPVATR